MLLLKMRFNLISNLIFVLFNLTKLTMLLLKAPVLCIQRPVRKLALKSNLKLSAVRGGGDAAVCDGGRGGEDGGGSDNGGWVQIVYYKYGDFKRYIHVNCLVN